MAKRVPAASAIVGTVLTVTAAGRAFPSSKLVYARGPGAEACADETSLRKAVAARLGYDPFFPSAEKTIVAQIRREGRDLRGTVQLIDDNGMSRGSRELKAPIDDCSELLARVALAISIAIDPTADSTGSPPPLDAPNRAPKEEARPPGGDLPPPRSEPVATPAHEGPPPRTWSWMPGATIGGSFGLAPAFAWTLGVAAGVRRAAWSVLIEGRRQFPASAGLAAGGFVEASAWTAGVASCFHASPVFVCAVGSAGQLDGRADGISQPRNDTALVAAAGARAGLEMPMTNGIDFRVHADLLANLTRVSLVVDQATVWEAPSVAATIAAGLAAHFP